MNVNGLINMVIRMVMRNLLNRGVNTAFDMVDRKRAKRSQNSMMGRGMKRESKIPSKRCVRLGGSSASKVFREF